MLGELTTNMRREKMDKVKDARIMRYIEKLEHDPRTFFVSDENFLKLEHDLIAECAEKAIRELPVLKDSEGNN